MHNKEFNYGIHGKIGNKIIAKLRIQHENWEKIEKYMKFCGITHERLFTNSKTLKTGKVQSYTHFTVICTLYELNAIKRIQLARKVEELNKLIEYLAVQHLH